MSDIQQELNACKEYAEEGYQIAEESLAKLETALQEEMNNLQAKDNQQKQIRRLENDKHFGKQFKAMKTLENQTVKTVRKNLHDLQEKMSDFTIVLYGRTMAGKSTLMEILTHGNGQSIGKGAQRTTLDVRDYYWNGLRVFDVPGTCSFGGKEDDELAFEAAKTADLALFLLTDDAPQPEEAERLGELRKLGKPVLGIINVKQVLDPNPQSPRRRVYLKQVERKLNDFSRLQEIERQFKEFSQKNGYNFDDVKFVYSHLQSAFFSQRENNPELYNLSNFQAVENFILDKVIQDGRFIRIKTFIDAVALPMQNAVAALYGQSSGTVEIWLEYKDKIDELDKWREKFFERVQERYNTFFDKLESQIDNQISYITNNYYDSKYAGDYFKERIDGLNIQNQCEVFIKSIAEEATRKMHELADNLTEDLKYSGFSMNTSSISMGEITDWQGGLMMAAPLLMLASGPIGLAVGLGAWLFGDSKETKIRKAKDELRGELNKATYNQNSGFFPKMKDSVADIINEKIFNEQIWGFRNILIDMYEMLRELAYQQNKIADAINFQYQDLTWHFLWEAIRYVGGNPKNLEQVLVARSVGSRAIIFSTTNPVLPELVKDKIEKMLGEKISTYYVLNGENYWRCIFTILEKQILQSDFYLPKFVENEESGDMYLISLPANKSFSEEQIHLAQQILGDPVFFESYNDNSQSNRNLQSNQNTRNNYQDEDVSPFFYKLREIIVEQLGAEPEEIQMDSTFDDDLGADSLDAVELMMAVEEEFNIEIPDEIGLEMKTVGDVVNYIARCYR